MTEARSVSLQTIAVSFLSLGGILTSLLNSVVVAYLYGASGERDAFLLASVIPAYVASVFSGNLALLFVPLFLQYHATDPKRAWSIASGVLSLSGVALTALVILFALFAVPLMAWIAPAQLETLSLAAELMRVLAPSILFNALLSLCSSLLYAEHRFLLPSVAPIVSGVVTVLCNALLHPWFGIHSLAIGSTLGALVALLVVAPGVIRHGKVMFRIDLRDAGFRQLARSSLPLVLASLLYRFNGGFERLIGATLPAGSISFVTYAAQIVQVLSTLTSSAVVTTVFPLLASSWATRDMTAVRRYFGIAIRSVLLVSLPTASFFMLFARDVVATLLQRGRFDAASTDAVTSCVAALLVGFVAANVGNVVTRCFYVTQRTTLLAFYTVVETAFYVGSAILLSQRYSYQGLAASVSLRDSISVCLYFAVASRIFGGLGGRALLRDALKLATCTAALTVALLTVHYGLADKVVPALRLCTAIFLGAPLYIFLAVRVFRIEEAVRIVALIVQRFPLLRAVLPTVEIRKDAP